MSKWINFLVVSSAILNLSHCLQITTKKSSVVLRRRNIDSSVSTNNYVIASGRDYNSGGSYGNLMSFPSLETSLTTLAFLSFGAFLLSMILQAMNVTGRRRRDTSFCMENCDENVYEFSEAARLALNALRFAVFDRQLPECEARDLCNTFRTARKIGGIVTLAPLLTTASLDFLHENKPNEFTDDKWKFLEKIARIEDCEIQFPNCGENVSEVVSGKELGKDSEKWKVTRKWYFKSKSPPRKSNDT